MYMIEIAAIENGAHNNQTFHGFLPDGWALVPDNLETENFPFGEVIAEEIDGIMTVTGWTALPMPEPEPEPETPTVPTELEQLRADVDYIAMETGVEL